MVGAEFPEIYEDNSDNSKYFDSCQRHFIMSLCDDKYNRNEN